MERIHGQDMNVPENYADIRIGAERIAAEKMQVPPTLEQIYAELKKTYGNVSDSWMNLELKFEYEGIHPNPQCVGFFKSCVRAGKTVVLISDMYLSSDFIGRLLEKCGIVGYRKLYVSCEMGCRKSDGTLFKEVLSDLGIRPGQLLHIGDSKRADFLAPISLGVHVRNVQKQQKRLCRKPDFVSEGSALTYRTLQAVAANCSSELSEYAKCGCSIFGPLLSGYTYWLVQRLKKDEIQDVYFLSRDGWMLKRAFDELHIKDIRTHYLYGSRRSYLVPTLWKYSEFSDVMNYIKRDKRINLSTFLWKIGLDPSNYRECASELGLDIDFVYEHDSFWQDAAVRQFYEIVRKDVVKHSREEYDALVDYLKSLNMPKIIAIADVGYIGTIQYALQQVIEMAGLDIEVRGYYLGVHPDAQYVLQGLIRAEGYLHDIGKNENYIELIGSGMALCEVQFFIPDGSVNHFIVRNGCPTPVFDEFEYALEDGKTVDEEAIVKEYQSGAMAFVIELHEAFGHQFMNIEPDAALFNWLKLNYSPTLREARVWGGFRVWDGDLRVLAHPKNALSYLRSPRALKKDFLSSRWKIGFMKQLFKVPLPYYKLYIAMKRRYNE